MMINNQKHGFTLIELLMVIAIIGLLATLSVTAFKDAQKKTRDTRRMSDLNQLQKAVEMYIQEYGAPPITSDYGEANTGGWDSSSQGDFMQFLKSSAGSANPRNVQFMQKVPVDPINNGSGDCWSDIGSGYYTYCYYYYSSALPPRYQIGTNLEKSGTYWLATPMN